MPAGCLECLSTRVARSVVRLGLLLARYVEWVGDLDDVEHDPSAPRGSTWPRAEAWLARDTTIASLERDLDRRARRPS